MAFLWRAMGEAGGTRPAADRLAAPAWPIDGGLDPEMRSAFGQALERLRIAGFAVDPVSLPESFNELPRAAKCVMKFEAAQVHGERFEQHGPENRRQAFRAARRRPQDHTWRVRIVARSAGAGSRGFRRAESRVPGLGNTRSTGPGSQGIGFDRRSLLQCTLHGSRCSCCVAAVRCQPGRAAAGHATRRRQGPRGSVAVNGATMRK